MLHVAESLWRDDRSPFTVFGLIPLALFTPSIHSFLSNSDAWVSVLLLSPIIQLFIVWDSLWIPYLCSLGLNVN